MKYKLIATDMDGTLLNSEVKVPENNIRSIIDAQKKGITFVLASGRPSFAMRDTAKTLEMEKFGGYIVSFNGGEVINCKTNERIFNKGLTKEEIIAMYNYAQENKISFLTYNDDILYTNSIDEYTKVEARFTFGKLTMIEDIEKLDFTKTTKCMLLSCPDNLIKHEEILKSSKYVEKLNFARSMPIFLEVTNKDVDKGKTMAELIKLLNIDKSEFIAAGDSYNDIPLLEAAGLKVAPSNAKDEIKEMVDYVGVSNNEGIIADLIEKYVD